MSSSSSSFKSTLLVINLYIFIEMIEERTSLSNQDIYFRVATTLIMESELTSLELSMLVHELIVHVQIWFYNHISQSELVDYQHYYQTRSVFAYQFRDVIDVPQIQTWLALDWIHPFCNLMGHDKKQEIEIDQWGAALWIVGGNRATAERIHELQICITGDMICAKNKKTD
ncbi:hypothetical protein ACJX0J_010399 [Zea mays]